MRSRYKIPVYDMPKIDVSVHVGKKGIRSGKTARRSIGKQFMFRKRSLVVNKYLVGQRIRVHNGRTYYKLYITTSKLGRKLGEFIPTRTLFVYGKRKRKRGRRKK
jgi:ribosomal protein S19